MAVKEDAEAAFQHLAGARVQRQGCPGRGGEIEFDLAPILVDSTAGADYAPLFVFYFTNFTELVKPPVFTAIVGGLITEQNQIDIRRGTSQLAGLRADKE